MDRYTLQSSFLRFFLSKELQVLCLITELLIFHEYMAIILPHNSSHCLILQDNEKSLFSQFH